MLAIYIIPFIILCSGLVSSQALIIILYLISGLGMAGIGMGVMHDANHGSYSRNKSLNKLLALSCDMMGCSSRVWKLQHNVLHHSFTNIEGEDDDIAPPFILRFSPHSERNKLHRYQAFYFWLFYGLSTISWVTSKDFMSYRRYRKKGLVVSKKEYTNGMLRIALSKVFYFTYALVIPLIVIPASPLLIIGSFLLMHFMTGILISMVFQVAHVIPDTNFPLPKEENKIQKNWHIHQMETTANFSPNSRLLSWLIGGLNYQVEHHLFPNICHVHYRKLSKIVSQTAKEYRIDYIVNKNMVQAIGQHIKMLHHLGRA
ncbi:MAG: acyl-CoA desaturase [Flavobacteriales bacterium]|nr:acyl-CoA desaturase [Flavobacteriales bacterium]